MLKYHGYLADGHRGFQSRKDVVGVSSDQDGKRWWLTPSRLFNPSG
ncbi:MAG: hypothetical protein QW172_06455 [Candidatus Bathyarchaeia archaeon]